MTTAKHRRSSADPESIADAAASVLKYVQTGQTYQTDSVVRIPSERYTNQTVWQRECNDIFKRLPLCLAASAELAEPFSYKALEVVGLPVLITRDQDGLVRAFLNVCSHRAAPVTEPGCGLKKRFSCPYHGWTYGADGRLIGIADPHKFGQLDKSALGLPALPCLEQAGLIFVLLDPKSKLDITDFLGGMLDDVASMGFESWCYLGQRELQGANWKIAMDGYLEGYHFKALHPETIHPRTPANITHYQAYGPHMRIAFPQVTIEQALVGKSPAELAQMENTGFDFVRILFPNVSIFIAPEITQISQLYPGDTPDTNRTVLTFLRKDAPQSKDDKQALEGMMDWLLGVVRDEDYAMGDLIQKGLESGAHKDIILGKNERGNQYFHEYIEWYLNKNQDAPRPNL